MFIEFCSFGHEQELLAERQIIELHLSFIRHCTSDEKTQTNKLFVSFNAVNYLVKIN